MPPSEAVSVTPADLVSHASRVEAVAHEVGAARQAGVATSPGPVAYGRLCLLVPVLLSGLQDIVAHGIGTAENSLHDTAQRLRTTADSYQRADEQSASAIRRAGGPS